MPTVELAAWAGEAHLLHPLRALCGERGEEPALAAAGCAADYLEAETARRLSELSHDFAAVAPVAARERRRVPAYLAQHVDHRGGALPAAPAIDEGAPAAIAAAETLVDVQRDVLRNQRRADFFRVERRDLLVERADVGPLRIVEHRAVQGFGHMIEREFGGRAHVDHLVKGIELCYRNRVRTFL